jgi:hypothetical protein
MLKVVLYLVEIEEREKKLATRERESQKQEKGGKIDSTLCAATVSNS